MPLEDPSFSRIAAAGKVSLCFNLSDTSTSAACPATSVVTDTGPKVPAGPDPENVNVPTLPSVILRTTIVGGLGGGVNVLVKVQTTLPVAGTLRLTWRCANLRSVSGKVWVS